MKNLKVNKDEALRMALVLCIEKYKAVEEKVRGEIVYEGKEYTDEEMADMLYKCSAFTEMVYPTIALYFGELGIADPFSQEIGRGGLGRVKEFEYAITKAVFNKVFAFNSMLMREKIKRGENPFQQILSWLNDKEKFKKIIEEIRKFVLL